MIEDQEGQEVADVAAAWEAVLTETEKVDPTVKAAGSRRRTSGSSAASVQVDVGPKVRTSDVAPLIKALGGVTTRLAEVSPLTDDEVEGIAEPSAKLLEILAPETPPWMIPAMTLSARIGDAAAARRTEFIQNRAKSEADKPLPGKEGDAATSVEDEF